MEAADPPERHDPGVLQAAASVSTPEESRRYLDVISGDAARASAADDYFLDREPRHASMLRTSVSPTMIQGGYRINVIPSEAKARLDVRTHPDEDLDGFLSEMRKVIDDPAVEVAWAERDVRPASGRHLSIGRLQGDRGQRHEALPDNHAADDVDRRDRHVVPAREGHAVLGVGPMTDVEDGAKGFAAHSDQERILESELYRFVRFHYDVVADLATAR